MICRACGKGIPADARFCMFCAAPLARSCAACNSDLPDEALFCPHCAHPADARTTTVSDNAAPAPAQRNPRAYTPHHLADEILRNRSALEGERKQVTVLFADVKGSMELADQVGAEAWHRILDRFFQILSGGVHRFEGTVNQYTGDGIMALFGAPIAHEDHAQRACYAALWLRDALRDYADELRRTESLSFSVRIGLNSGDVVVGSIGDDLRMDYTAQGLTVGLAQRMEQLAAAGSTYLTQHTAHLVEGFFALRALGEFALKGVAEPLSVFELEGTGSMRTRLELSRARGFSRFVGRSDELGVLDGALQRALEERGGAIGVVADAGVGKSRLCLEFTERCRARNITVFQAHCPAHGKLIPLLPVYELLRDVFGIVENDSEQTVREKIAGRLLLLDRDFDASLPLVFDFLGVPDAARPLDTIDPAQRQREMGIILRRLVQARSLREPAVILVDDVHWIDSGSDEFLAGLAETVSGTRTLLLLNFRPEYSAAWMSDSSYQQLPLRPLGDEATDELLAHLLGSDASTAPLRPLIRERTAGNPFFIEEAVQSLLEAGSLVGERGAYTLHGSVDSLQVPTSVQAILAARIDRLAPRDKTVLQTAAAIGRKFTEPLLRRVCELPDMAFDDSIAVLRRAELVQEEALYPDVEYAFRHPLTHEVAQGSQLQEQRATVHARIAAAIEVSWPDRLDENAALLAHHWDEAGEAVPAARCHRRAAERIAGGNAPEAKRHWERVRELSERIDKAELSLELGQQSRLMVLEYSWRIGIAREEAHALLEEGEVWAKRNDDPHALAAIYNAFSMPCAFSLGEPWRAADIARKGLHLAVQLGDEALAFALELRIFFSTEPIGLAAEARQAIEAANRRPVEVMQAASPLVGYDAHATAVGFCAWPHLWVGELDLALQCVRSGMVLAREHDSTEVLGWLMGIEASAHTLRGENSLLLAREAYEIAERIDSDLSRTLACIQFAPTLMAEGDFEAAAAILERIAPIAAASFKQVEPEVLCQVSAARSGMGVVTAAREAAQGALDLSLERRLYRGEVLSRTALARVALEHGRLSELPAARKELDRAAAQAHEIEHVYLLPEIFELQARIAEREEDTDAREKALRAALELYEQMAAPLQVERITSLL